MDRQEMLDKYKSQTMAVRVCLGFIPGLALGGYLYFTEGEALETALEQKKTEETNLKVKFEDARRKKASLPQKQEELVRLEEQLIVAKDSLPEEVFIDEILQRTATVASEVGVDLILFDPQSERAAGGAYRYTEIGIRVHLEGKYNQIAAFFNRMTHLEQLVHVRDISLSGQFGRSLDKKREGGNRREVDPNLVSEVAKERRREIAVKAEANLIVFRALSAEEQAASKPAPKKG